MRPKENLETTHEHVVRRQHVSGDRVSKNQQILKQAATEKLEDG